MLLKIWSHLSSPFMKISPAGPPPTTKDPNSESIDVGITDVNFGVVEVYYINSFGTENITAGISDISFVVSEV